MPIGFSDGTRFEDEYEYVASQVTWLRGQDISPAGSTSEASMSLGDDVIRGPDTEMMARVLEEQTVGGGTGANALNQPLADHKLRLETEYVGGSGQKDISYKAPITAEDNAIPRITVTPRPIEDKPMDEPFKDEAEKVEVFNMLDAGKGNQRILADKLTGRDGQERYQLWPEKAVRSMLHGFSLPRDVAVGETNPLSQEATGRAFELASAMVFGPAPVASKIVDGTLGSIAGISAKTADKDALKIARQMEQQGHTTEEIWNYTGWFKGFDKQWKHELPSERAIFTRDQRTIKHDDQLHLQEILHFDALFNAYPELRKLNVTINNTMSDMGRFTEGMGHYVVSGEKHPGEMTLRVKGLDTNAILDTILHEVQHYIQKKEGFDYGTSVKGSVLELAEALKQKLDAAKTPSDIARISTLIQKIAQEKSKLGQEMYRGSPGEREARLVESRRAWPGSDKIQESPIKTQRRIDETAPVETEIRMPWEKAPITVD